MNSQDKHDGVIQGPDSVASIATLPPPSAGGLDRISDSRAKRSLFLFACAAGAMGLAILSAFGSFNLGLPTAITTALMFAAILFLLASVLSVFLRTHRWISCFQWWAVGVFCFGVSGHMGGSQLAFTERSLAHLLVSTMIGPIGLICVIVGFIALFRAGRSTGILVK